MSRDACRCGPAPPLDCQLRHRRRARGPDAARFSRLRRARARASVPHVSALQLVVRHRLLQQVRRGRGACARLHAFGTELHQKRGVTLDSFLFDDGWDDPKTLWHFNAGFPERLHERSERDASATAPRPASGCRRGVDTASRTKQRSTYGKAQGFETNEDGFALSGPVYYKRFRDTCIDMIRQLRRESVQVRRNGQLREHVSREPVRQRLRRRDPSHRRAARGEAGPVRESHDGTYPSPFWLRYADSIWRGGEDHDFAGIGTSRQRWITYRDADTYEHVVRAGALFPLNSLMLHGMIYARAGAQSDDRSGQRLHVGGPSYFGTGTQLQEMYITPSLLSQTQLGHDRRMREVVARQRRHARRYALGRRRSATAGALRMGVVVASEGNSHAAESEQRRAEHRDRRRACLRAARARHRASIPRASPWARTAGARPVRCFSAGEEADDDSVRALRRC